MENFLRFRQNGLDILLTTKANGNMLYQRGGPEVFKSYTNLAAETGIELNKIVRVVLANSSQFIKVSSHLGGEGVFPEKQNLKGYDGLITSEKGLYLGITTADCFPVIIHDPVKNHLGLAHCGWRGIVEKLEVKIFEEIIKMGSNLEDIIITYSGGICASCYVQHDEYLREVFINKYRYPENIIGKAAEHYTVDIKKASQSNLREAGYNKDFIDLNICNFCDERLFSVRRDGKDAGRILNLVGML